MPKTTTAQPKAERVHREFEGRVVSAKEQKTIHVLIETKKKHEKYMKQYTTSKKYAVHDEKGEAAIGDLVRIEECRPYSRTKRWRLVSVVTKAA